MSQTILNFKPEEENHHPELHGSGDDDKSPLLRESESTDSERKISNKYKISLDELVSIIQEGENRTFTEEIDKLEPYGGQIILKNLYLLKNFLIYLEKFFEKALNTDFIKGISSAPNELKLREEAFGNNKKKPRETESFYILLIENFKF